MIERGVGPLHGVVAGFTGGGKAGMRHRSGCVVVVGLVTTYASGGGQVVVIVDVAVSALARRSRV